MLLDHRPVLVRLKADRHFLEAFAQIELAALLQLLQHAVAEPVEQLGIILGQGVQDPVHALFH